MFRRKTGRFDRLTAAGATAALVLVAAPCRAGACLPDLDGDGSVGFTDLTIFFTDIGPCPGCPSDFNLDDVVDNVDLAFLLENWGPCSAGQPGSSELFDEVLAFDVTNAEAQGLGLLVTNLYATGPAVDLGDRLLIVGSANITAEPGTTFFQEPHLASFDETPPSAAEITVIPQIAYDTFVTIGVTTDEVGVINAQPIAETDTTVTGGWFTQESFREAVDISALTGIPGQYGVLIAQITLDAAAETTIAGYSGAVRLYTSSLDDGSLEGVDVAFAFTTPDNCPPDLDGDGSVSFSDLTILFGSTGCSGCPADLNRDGVVDQVDTVYLLESWGPCPSGVPGDTELFDRVAIVNATDREAAALGLHVTRVYATGDVVLQGDALLIVDEASISATGPTQFYQDPVGSERPPTSPLVSVVPSLRYDTFVATGLLLDDLDLNTDNVTMSETSIGGYWFATPPSTQREALEVCPNDDQYAVLIAQITLDLSSTPTPGYVGSVRLYTSTADDGSLQGVDVPITYEVDPTVDPCQADFDDSTDIGFPDLTTLLSAWGLCPGCPQDLDDNGCVGFTDLTALLALWGPCP